MEKTQPTISKDSVFKVDAETAKGIKRQIEKMLEDMESVSNDDWFDQNRYSSMTCSAYDIMEQTLHLMDQGIKLLTKADKIPVSERT